MSGDDSSDSESDEEIINTSGLEESSLQDTMHSTTNYDNDDVE